MKAYLVGKWMETGGLPGPPTAGTQLIRYRTFTLCGPSRLSATCVIESVAFVGITLLCESQGIGLVCLLPSLYILKTVLSLKLCMYECSQSNKDWTIRPCVFCTTIPLLAHSWVLLICPDLENSLICDVISFWKSKIEIIDIGIRTNGSRLSHVSTWRSHSRTILPMFSLVIFAGEGCCTRFTAFKH